jgi:hypothetical protein
LPDGPLSSVSIKFADFYKYQDDAGGTRLFTNSPLPISFETVISLRDPLAGNVEYNTQYRLDLQHLLEYPMEEPIASNRA